jgi:peptidoglycan/xylan/chitin deacetylase (PgdA/CDA1 family)
MLILLLHHVGTPPREAHQRKLYISPKTLVSYVNGLSDNGYKFATLSQALQMPEPVACITFDDGFRNVVTDLLEVPGPKLVPATMFVVTSRVGERGVTFEGDQGVAPSDLANWDELKRLRDQGWEIGSHSHSHRRKPSKDDLAQSREVLRKQLQIDVTSLAYPYGSFDEQVIESAKSVGFHCAATTRSGIASRDEPFRLNRVILSSYGVFPPFERFKLWGVQRGIYPLRKRR